MSSDETDARTDLAFTTQQGSLEKTTVLVGFGFDGEPRTLQTDYDFAARTISKKLDRLRTIGAGKSLVVADIAAADAKGERGGKTTSVAEFVETVVAMHGPGVLRVDSEGPAGPDLLGIGEEEHSLKVEPEDSDGSS
jgi:hypothetical protein